VIDCRRGGERESVAFTCALQRLDDDVFFVKCDVELIHFEALNAIQFTNSRSLHGLRLQFFQRLRDDFLQIFLAR
jgi:hypothetical protein